MQRLTALLTCVFVYAAATAADPAIVKAKVTQLGAKQLATTAFTLEIVHVYRGDPTLKGKSFNDLWREFGGGWSGGDGDVVTAKPVEVGEEGLWLVTDRDGTLTPTRGEVGLRLGRRVRKNESPDGFAAAVKMAEVIEKYGRLKNGDQLAEAEKLAFDDDSSIEYWAVHAIGKMTGKAADDALDRFLGDRKLPRHSQIALDEVLSRRRSGWPKSKEQLSMYREWVNGKADEHTTPYILSRLSSACQNGKLDSTKGVELFIVAAENANWKTKDRIQAMFYVIWHGNKLEDQERPFEWLVSQVRENTDLDLRRAAAASLSGLHKAPDRLKTLSALLATQTDEKVIEHLKAAIAQPK